MTKEVNEQWVNGLSDCCRSPVKEVGSGITILVCCQCGNMCDLIIEDDDFPEDLFDE
jgi:hypothetical protein